jgi:multidrug efflux pump
MDQITGALIGIATVLSAVFLPMAFLRGSTGVIYRQFSITIVSAMVLSVIIAIVLTPALVRDAAQAGAQGRTPHNRGFFAGSTATSRAAPRYRAGGHLHPQPHDALPADLPGARLADGPAVPAPADRIPAG